MLATFYLENRIIVPFERIVPTMGQAVVATEDQRFFQHGGVDPTAIALKQKYSRQDILGRHLNIARSVPRVRGRSGGAVQLQQVRGRPDYLEAATLAGVTQSPTRWDPAVNPQRSQSRRNVVLRLMRDQAFITQAEYDAGVAAPVVSVADGGYLTIQGTSVGCMAANAVAGSGYFCQRMASQLNLCAIMDGAKSIGVHQAFGRDIGVFAPNVLRSESLAPRTMASAFASFASNGRYCEPIALTAVTNSARSHVFEGTGRPFGALDRTSAGKTGTTSQNEHT
ncbi:MAG: transglycosylase domain-containing protein [Cellulomonas sp.]|nr:transglycosylase domain-containing protein [Cellulomonas sp.]